MGTGVEFLRVIVFVLGAGAVFLAAFIVLVRRWARRPAPPMRSARR